VGGFWLWMTQMAVTGTLLYAFYRLNRWLVDRKGLDHRPYYVPSLWGPIGTLIIFCAQPVGWKRLT
jgi:hypothetical protein